ncbi:MAG: hypothetical protein J3Q66DRAFT_407217 [Benniella sp.]|nr:MAG: hypothetical protein J3Q66DRAFT_407217 [Benniella sp.]
MTTDNCFVAAAVEGRGAGAETVMRFCNLKSSEAVLCPLCRHHACLRSIHEMNGGSSTRKNHSLSSGLVRVRAFRGRSAIAHQALFSPEAFARQSCKQELQIIDMIETMSLTWILVALNDSSGISTTGYLSQQSISTVDATNLATKYFCLSATAAVMRHIEDARIAASINHSAQFKIPLRLDSVQELAQSEETHFSLRTTPKAFNDVDHSIASFIQAPTKPRVKHSEQASIALSTYSTR